MDSVRCENPRNLLALEGIAVTRTLEEAARKLENTGVGFRPVYRELRRLGRTFLTQKAGPQLAKRVMAEQRARETNASTAVTHPQVEPSRIPWNRVDLYNEVWSQPLVRLSQKYGISDVRLGKVCRRLEIPHPGRGYWAKKAVGQPMEQVPLPEFSDAPAVRRLKTKSSRRKLRPQRPRDSQEGITALSEGTSIRVRLSTC